MNNNELNIAILEELKQIATEIFADEIDISPGTYTAAELAKLKDTKGADIIINYIETNSESILMRSVRVENFKCEFERENIFSLIWKFEQLSGTRQKDKVHFVKIETAKADLSFDVEITKEMHSLCKCIGDNEEHPILDYVFIDYDRGYLVASNGKRLKACKTNISNLDGKTETSVLINPKDLKQLSGICHVSVSDWKTTITDKDGRTYSVDSHVEDSHVKFPNWFSVVPKVSNNNFIKINEVKEVLCFLKNKEGLFSIQAEKSGIVTIDYINSDSGCSSKIDVTTEDEIPFPFSLTIDVNNFRSISTNWNGGLFLDASHKAVVLTNENESLCFAMPYTSDKGDFRPLYFNFDRSNMIPFFEFFKKATNEIAPESEAINITAPCIVTPICNECNLSEQPDEQPDERVPAENIICIECEPEDIPDYWGFLDSVPDTYEATPAPVSIDAPTVFIPERLPSVSTGERLPTVYVPERLYRASVCHHLITCKGLYYLVA